MTEIQSFVKQVRIKEQALYHANLDIVVIMNDGKKIKFRTTGEMTIEEIINAIVERLEK